MEKLKIKFKFKHQVKSEFLVMRGTIGEGATGLVRPRLVLTSFHSRSTFFCFSCGCNFY